MKKRKYQEGGMTSEEDQEKYGRVPREPIPTSGGFPPRPKGFSVPSVNVTDDGRTAGIGPSKPQSSGLLRRDESMLGKVAKAFIPGGMGATAGVAAAEKLKRKKEEGYKSGGYVRAADGCAQRGKTKGTMVVMK